MPLQSALHLLRGIRDTVRTTTDVLGYVVHQASVVAPLTFLLSLLEGLLPVASLWLVKRVVDIITGADGVDRSPGSFTVLVAAFVAVGVLSQVFLSLGQYFHNDLAQRLQAASRASLLAKANSFPGLQYFDVPEFHDRLRAAEHGSGRRFYAVIDMTTGLIRSGTVIVTSVAMLGSLDPLLGVVIVAGTLPYHYASWWTFKRRAELFRMEAPDAREQDYFSTVLTSADTAKEIRAFDLGAFFLGKFNAAFDRVYRRYHVFRSRAAWYGVTTGTLAGGVSAGAFAWVAVQAYRGELTAGDAVLYIGLLPQLTRVLSVFVGQVSNFHVTSLYTRHFFDFLRIPSDISITEAPVPRAREHTGYEFRDVTFRYPGSDVVVLDHVSFMLRPGERVALLGENGSGKTTLVKLLMRFYDPDEGQVLLDGVPLPEYDVADLRRRTSAVFQDFARFYLPVRDCIAVGDSGREPAEDWIIGAAKEAQADGFIERLPHGYDTRLGRHFDDGAELSGGQWQRIALARAFARDAETVILDEPSAALDPRAEYRLFERFRELTAGRTALFVTHRLGCVRMADRILVCRSGGIVEDGSHEELMALDGEYAEMFRMQAEQYGSLQT